MFANADMPQRPDRPVTDRQPPMRYHVTAPADLGSAIAHLRRRQNVPQADLAVRTGLNRTYLSELEGGNATIQMQRLFVILAELGLTMTLATADDQPGQTPEVDSVDLVALIRPATNDDGHDDG